MGRYPKHRSSKQGNAFRDLKDVKVYPSIGMKRPHAHATVNFGHKPFVFDIDGMMSVSIASSNHHAEA